MVETANLNLDYDRPVRIAEDVFWVGFYDTESGLHCNPYLVVDGEEAVVIDGGSRPHFPIVMMKILQVGLHPSAITALIYHHYDPDLCGSIPNFEDLIGRPDLKIISDSQNNVFIRHYSVKSRLLSLEAVDHTFKFSSGRVLRFVNTPYAHAAGSFITFDEKTGVLFTSDLFGSYGQNWQLFLELSRDCHGCRDYGQCPTSRRYCPLPDVLRFHQAIMPSEQALRYALDRISTLPFSIIAPQHGSVIHKPEDIKMVAERLATLEGVGIDRILGDKCYLDLECVNPLIERLTANE